MPDRLLYRIAEAAEVLGVSKSILYDLIRAGEIPVIRVRSDLRVPVAGLHSWIARQPPGQVHEPPPPRRRTRRTQGQN